MSEAKPYTKEEIARKAWIREWQSGGDEARWLATLDARDAESAALKARLAEAERVIRDDRAYILDYCRSTSEAHPRVARIRSIDAFLRPAAPPAIDEALFSRTDDAAQAEIDRRTLEGGFDDNAPAAKDDATGGKGGDHA